MTLVALGATFYHFVHYISLCALTQHCDLRRSRILKGAETSLSGNNEMGVPGQAAPWDAHTARAQVPRAPAPAATLAATGKSKAEHHAEQTNGWNMLKPLCGRFLCATASILHCSDQDATLKCHVSRCSTFQSGSCPCAQLTRSCRPFSSSSGASPVLYRSSVCCSCDTTRQCCLEMQQQRPSNVRHMGPWCSFQHVLTQAVMAQPPSLARNLTKPNGRQVEGVFRHRCLPA
jgi:hypothetical protein